MTIRLLLGKENSADCELLLSNCMLLALTPNLRRDRAMDRFAPRSQLRLYIGRPSLRKNKLRLRPIFLYLSALR